MADVPDCYVPADDDAIQVPAEPFAGDWLSKEVRDEAREINRVQGLPPKGITKNSCTEDAEVWVTWWGAILASATLPEQLMYWQAEHDRELAILEVDHPEQFGRLTEAINDIEDALSARL